MNTDNQKFPEQDAPLKNTDQAFVQVGKDGQPVMPETDNVKANDVTEVSKKEEHR